MGPLKWRLGPETPPVVVLRDLRLLEGGLKGFVYETRRRGTTRNSVDM